MTACVRNAFAAITTSAELEALLQELKTLAVATAARIGHDFAAEARAMPPVVVPEKASRKAAALLGDEKAIPKGSVYHELQRRCRQLKLPATGTAEVLTARLARADHEPSLFAQPASTSEPTPRKVEPPKLAPKPRPKRKATPPKASPPALYVQTRTGTYRRATVAELRRALAALEAVERPAA